MSVNIQGLRNAADFMKQASGVDPAFLREAADEIERLRKGIQDYLDGDYGRQQYFKTKHDKCPHGLFGWESCENCIDAHFA